MNLQAPDDSYEERKRKVQEVIDTLVWNPTASGIGVATEFHLYTRWRIFLEIPEKAEMGLRYHTDVVDGVDLIKVRGVQWELSKIGHERPVAGRQEFQVDTAVFRAVEAAMDLADRMKDDANNPQKLGRLLQKRRRSR